jgi:hypothetical protein
MIWVMYIFCPSEQGQGMTWLTCLYRIICLDGYAFRLTKAKLTFFERLLLCLSCLKKKARLTFFERLCLSQDYLSLKDAIMSFLLEKESKLLYCYTVTEVSNFLFKEREKEMTLLFTKEY